VIGLSPSTTDLTFLMALTNGYMIQRTWNTHRMLDIKS